MVVFPLLLTPEFTQAAQEIRSSESIQTYAIVNRTRRRWEIHDKKIAERDRLCYF